jgi:hypothetical protein
MAQEWFYSQGDRKVGPVSAKELKVAATAGTLQPTDLVWTDGMKDWKEARTVKGLAGVWSTSPGDTSAAPPGLPDTGTAVPVRQRATRPTRSASGQVGKALGGINLPTKLVLAGVGVFA